MKGKRKPIMIAAAVIVLAWFLWVAFNVDGKSITGSWVIQDSLIPEEDEIGSMAWAASQPYDYPKHVEFRKDGTYRWTEVFWGEMKTGTWRRHFDSSRDGWIPLEFYRNHPDVLVETYACEEGGKIVAIAHHAEGQSLHFVQVRDYPNPLSPERGADYARPGFNLAEIPSRLRNWVERTFRR